jgi:hypothetical protein
MGNLNFTFRDRVCIAILFLAPYIAPVAAVFVVGIAVLSYAC